MKLNVEDRIRIYEFIPDKGSYKIMKEATKAKKLLAFNEEEVRKFDISSGLASDGKSMQVAWNREIGNEHYVDIEFPPQILSIIVKGLKDKSEKGELTENLVSLYEKFVE